VDLLWLTTKILQRTIVWRSCGSPGIVEETIAEIQPDLTTGKIIADRSELTRILEAEEDLVDRQRSCEEIYSIISN